MVGIKQLVEMINAARANGIVPAAFVVHTSHELASATTICDLPVMARKECPLDKVYLLSQEDVDQFELGIDLALF